MLGELLQNFKPTLSLNSHIMLRVTTCEHSHFTDEENKDLKRTTFSEDPPLTQRELGFNGWPCFQNMRFQAFCVLIAAEEEVSSEMSHEEEDEGTL